MIPEFLGEREVAEILGRSRDWLIKHRSALERAGFPAIDRLIGLTSRKDLAAWIRRRRTIADTGPANFHQNDKAMGVNFDALRSSPY